MPAIATPFQLFTTPCTWKYKWNNFNNNKISGINNTQHGCSGSGGGGGGVAGMFFYNIADDNDSNVDDLYSLMTQCLCYQWIYRQHC